jgi:DNA-binding XRE family transcriptional regulator
MNITNGEGYWLLRRRAGMTMRQAARRWKVSEDRLRDWEKGREEAPSPGTCHAWSRLTPGEYSAIARRRMGWTLPDLANARGISRQTAWKEEHDQTASALDLARWWGEGYPGTALAARLRIRGPAV